MKITQFPSPLSIKSTFLNELIPRERPELSGSDDVSVMISGNCDILGIPNQANNLPLLGEDLSGQSVRVIMSVDHSARRKLQ